MDYFKECSTNDEAKSLFRSLCKELHPDTSGYDSEKEFIKMFTSFRTFKPSVENDFANKEFDADKFYNMIKSFDILNDIKVSFVGTFIWLEDLVQGATYNQIDLIKSITFDGYNNARFAGNKKMWYFSPIDYKKKGKKSFDFEQIKGMYKTKSFDVTRKKLG